MSILVIAEHDNNELKGATLNTISAAKEIGSEIDILVAGFSCQTVVLHIIEKLYIIISKELSYNYGSKVV